MSERKKIYWDTSCFICLLNRNAEKQRRAVCEDIVRHAQLGEFDIWTSMWTIVETIRPKKQYGAIPALSAWALKAVAAAPEGKGEFQNLWDYFYRNTNAPADKLNPAQITLIKGMFETWDCIKKAQVDQRTAARAVELSRDYGLKPADAVHAATAILIKATVLQRWDRDFNKVAQLIAVEEPAMITLQQALIEDYHKPVLELPNPNEQTVASKTNNKLEADSAHTSAVQGGDSGRAEGEAPGKAEGQPEKPKPAKEGGLGENGS